MAARVVTLPLSNLGFRYVWGNQKQCVFDLVTDLKVRVIQPLEERRDCRLPVVFQPAQPVRRHPAHLWVDVRQ